MSNKETIEGTIMQTKWEFKVCIHGVTEDLDWHTCDKCQRIAKKTGRKVVPRLDTYIVTSEDLSFWKQELRKKGFSKEQIDKILKERETT